MTDDLARALEDASDEKLSGVIDVLAGADGPEQLALRATLLRKLASRVMLRPAALLAEAADTEARAAVQRRIAAARIGVDAADGEVARAEEAAMATDAPERKAYDQAVQAGHLLARARDDLAKAADADAGPARLLELRGRISDAEAVDQHERGKLAAAQQATTTARGRLAEARERHRQAKAVLGAAKAALDQPLHADIDDADLAMTLLVTWPALLWGAATGELPPLSDRVREIIRVLAGAWADEIGAIPAGAAALVSSQRDAKFRERARHTMVDLPGGQQASVAALMTELGIGGPSALATTALGR
jgi:chromosome segregation protein